jgi:transcription elongation factor GreA
LASKTIFVCPLSPQLARIYNVCSREVRRAILLNRTHEHFWQPTFGDQRPCLTPLAKIKQRFAEIDQSSTSSVIDLPKEIAKARAHGDLPKMPNTSTQRAPGVRHHASASSSAWATWACSISAIFPGTAPHAPRAFLCSIFTEVRIEDKLVTTEEADVEKGLISTTSPIGKALLNRKVGDEVQVATPAGQKEFEIVRLVTIHEDE